VDRLGVIRRIDRNVPARDNAATSSREPLVTTTEQKTPKPAPWPIEFYRSAVGKKWVMALTGIALIGYVVAHLIGNLKIYLGADEINQYGEALRDLGGHLAPRTSILWILRGGLIVAFFLHVHAAYSLTYTNWKARGGAYRERDYAVASYASRTMRWTGTIVLLFLAFHLADLTWGVGPAATGEFVRGEVYDNVIRSLERVPVAILYGVANVALGFHLFHGIWSLFQSIGWNHPRFNRWRKYLAYATTALIVTGNLSFPVAVQAGWLST
jgi:succinate dehydrogenase / fumarate reductase cytochrome b subunit